MDWKSILQSKKFAYILYGVGALVVILAVFQAGIWVGYHKAAYSFREGDNYYRVFGMRRNNNNVIPGMPRGDFMDAHGAAGRIIKVSLPTFMIEGNDDVEKVVLIKDDTAIRRFREALQPKDLKPDDFVVVVGSPNNQAQLEAKLIRIMPPPPNAPDNGGRPQL